ncbi:MAG: DUF3786 domain-containing protein [Kiritimatiellaeota bacterium]|nr:DUF3786 domain-containing protein [Kiritimatiellota bacterium]
MTKKGVEEACDRMWDTLANLDPGDVCRRTGVTVAPASRTYICPSLGQEVLVDPGERVLSCASETGRILLGRLGYFSKIAILKYLVHGNQEALAGEMVSPAALVSGQLYFRGSHVLPTAQMAEAYAGDGKRFLERARDLGAEVLDYGDAAVKLFPLPYFPVALVLWHGDDEFPGRANVLLDAGCENQLPPDIVWSIAMLTVLMFLM